MVEMKPSTVLLMLAAFACVALYVLGVGLGATDRSTKKSGPAVSVEERQTWRERFFKTRAVKTEELGTSCTVTNGVLRIPPGGACDVDVKSSDTRVRSLELTPQPPVQVKVELTPRSKPSVPATFDPLKEAKKLDVMKEGAAMKVSCPPGAPPPFGCALKLTP